MVIQDTESGTNGVRFEPRQINVVALASQVANINDIDYESFSSSIDASCKHMGIKALVDTPQALATWARAKYHLGQYHESLSLSKNAEMLFQQSGSAHQIYQERLFQVFLFLALSDIDSAEEKLNSARMGSPHENAFQKELLFGEYRIAYSKGELVRAHKALREIESLQVSVAEALMVRVLNAVIDAHEERLEKCLSENFYDIECNNPFELQVPPALQKSMIHGRLQLAQMLASEGHVARAKHLLIDSTALTPDLRPQGALASALVMAGEKRFEAAFDSLNSGWQTAPHGRSTGETALVYWYRALIGLVALEEAEAFAYVESMLTLAKASNGGSMASRSLLLSAFLRCKRGDIHTAKSMLDEVIESNKTLCNVCSGMAVVIDGMIKRAYSGDQSEQESDAGTKRQEEARLGSFIPRESYLTVALLCNAHPQALAILVNHFSMMKIPSEFFNLIDTQAIIKDESTFSMISRTSDSQALKVRLAANNPAPREPEGQDNRQYHIQLLGNLKIRHNGCDIDISTWRKSKSRELFLSVLLQAGSDISREQIIETLWPDMSPDKARNNYYVTWSNLKRILQGGDRDRRESLPIKSSGSRCYVNREYCGVDIIDLVESIHEGHRASTSGDLDGAITQYQRTAKLYTGDLLPGDMYNEWLTAHREYYHTLFIEAMISATKISLELDKPSSAIFFIEHALRFERSREVLYEWAMRTYLHADRREDAIEMYHLCRKHLTEELGLDPSSTLRSLYSQAINA